MGLSGEVRDQFVDALPKTELHVHLEGTLEPPDIIGFATRNQVRLPWASEAELRSAYTFTGLTHFLDLFFQGCKVLRTRSDFYDLTSNYLNRAASQGVRRAEMFFGPQTFLDLGISIDTQFGGINDAVDDARADRGIESTLLVSAHRHRSQSDALELLDLVRPYRDRIVGVGLGGAELGNPPSKFGEYFRAARSAGYRLTCHAGEEAPSAYIRDALAHGIDRIDHGFAAATDADLITRLADERIPLTMCPLSNLRLQVTDDLATYPIRRLMAAGVVVTVNSDDPPYFGGYVNENYQALADELDLSIRELAELARNSFVASFASLEDATAGAAAVTKYESDW